MSRTFCVLPFYGKEVYSDGKITPCCLLKHQNLGVIQQELLNDQQSGACTTCWDLEKQGITSDRQLKNSAYDYYTDRDISFVIEDCKQKKNQIEIVKLYTSTLCNGLCTTCGSHSSSSWARLEGRAQVRSQLNTEQLDQINWADVKMLTLVGGEPLYEKQNFYVLEQLLKYHNYDCFISITTNGSVVLNEKQIAVLKQFKNLNFCVSIDGVGPVFEYLRYPFKWPTLLDNLHLYQGLGINVTVSYTISNLNIFYHQETISWFKSQNLDYNHNLVIDPEYFNVNSLPESVKKSITHGKELLREHQPTDIVKYEKFLQEIKRQDCLKKISAADYLPLLFEKLK